MTETPDQAQNRATDQIGPAGTQSLANLLQTYTAWSGQHVLVEASRRAEAAGDTDRADALRTLAAGDAAAPNALEALRAQHELASLLEGWRWQTVAAARKDGATWSEIGLATRTEATEALADYLAAVDEAERSSADPDRLSFDAERAESDASVAEGELAGRELLDRAEQRMTVAREGATAAVRTEAQAELDTTAEEAERRAAAHGPDSVAAQVAGYLSLLREDTDQTLALEAAAWRAELDHLLPATPTNAPAATPGHTVAEVAREIDAHMHTKEPDGDAERFDLEARRTLGPATNHDHAQATTGRDEVAEPVDGNSAWTDGLWTDEHRREWSTLDTRATENGYPSAPRSREKLQVQAPNDPDGLRGCIDRMRARLAAEDQRSARDADGARDRLAHWTADLDSDGEADRATPDRDHGIASEHAVGEGEER